MVRERLAAQELVQRIYAGKPGTFTHPIKRYAKAWLCRHRFRLSNQMANED